MKRRVTHTAILYLQAAFRSRTYGDFQAMWTIRDCDYSFGDGSIEEIAEEHLIDHVLPIIPVP